MSDAMTRVTTTPNGKVKCRPFLLQVMVFSPESGYKFNVEVEKACTPTAEPLWKIVFDLFTVDDEGKETQIVHVSYKAATPVEQKTVERMASQGVKKKQADVLINEVHPAAKAVEGVENPSNEQKAEIRDAMKKVVSVDV